MKTLSGLIFLLLSILLLSLTAAYWAPAYIAHCFLPLQRARTTLLSPLPFSLGDVLYAATACYLLYHIVRFFRRRRQQQQRPGAWRIIRQLLTVVMGFYLLLFVLWGLVYEQPRLARRLGITGMDRVSKEELIAFDSLLVQRLNQLQPGYQSLALQQINPIAAAAYTSRAAGIAVHAKASLLGNGMAYTGIDGYFNPFTGEAQVNGHNPHFMQPFIVAHEMAHQAGVAEEGDANLMAYITCMESRHPTLQYSACLNLWLYAHRKVRGIDSNRANTLKRQLNAVSRAQLDTLKQRQEQFHTFLDDWSAVLFDAYLKLENQKEGLGSYRSVVYSALCWERQRHRPAAARYWNNSGFPVIFAKAYPASARSCCLIP